MKKSWITLFTEYLERKLQKPEICNYRNVFSYIGGQPLAIPQRSDTLLKMFKSLGLSFNVIRMKLLTTGLVALVFVYDTFWSYQVNI